MKTKILTMAQMKDADPKVQKRIDTLKVWRRKASKENAISAFVVFPNRTLMEIAKENPKSIDDLYEINGLGDKRIASYGKAILKCLRNR